MRTLSASEAAGLIGAGQVVGIPTDTVYGLAVDPSNPEAIESLYAIKGRSSDKPIGLLAADRKSVAFLVVMSDWAGALAEKHWPGPLTLVCPALADLPARIGDPIRRTVGVRVPAHPAALELLKITGPLAVTSANLSGGPECASHDAAYLAFGDAVAGYVAGSAPIGAASTVVDATGVEPLVLRPGPVTV